MDTALITPVVLTAAIALDTHHAARDGSRPAAALPLAG